MQTLNGILYFDDLLLGRILLPGDGFVAVPDKVNTSESSLPLHLVSVWTGDPDDLIWDVNGTSSYSQKNPEASWNTRKIIARIAISPKHKGEYREIRKAGLYSVVDWENIKQPNVTIFRRKKPAE